MSGGLSWERDGRDWPNREKSLFVSAAGFRWHVQRMGHGPVLLLLHGTGASTHSWRALAPILAAHFTVIALDLPGHGFTERPPSKVFALPRMARAVRDLMQVLEVVPSLAIGHSAGAAVAVRMTLDGGMAPRGLVSLNGAFLPFRGFARRVFSPLAKLMVMNPLVPRLFARTASNSRSVERLIRETGSTLDRQGVDLYGRLVRNPSHVASALGMMAEWDLEPLLDELPRLNVPLLLVTGSRDLTVPPEGAFEIRDLVPGSRVECLRGLGHLAHEERPQLVADIIIRFSRQVGSLDVSAG